MKIRDDDFVDDDERFLFLLLLLLFSSFEKKDNDLFVEGSIQCSNDVEEVLGSSILF